jgi:hypothetical protein
VSRIAGDAVRLILFERLEPVPWVDEVVQRVAELDLARRGDDDRGTTARYLCDLDLFGSWTSFFS